MKEQQQEKQQQQPEPQQKQQQATKSNFTVATVLPDDTKKNQTSRARKKQEAIEMISASVVPSTNAEPKAASDTLTPRANTVIEEAATTLTEQTIAKPRMSEQEKEKRKAKKQKKQKREKKRKKKNEQKEQQRAKELATDSNTNATNNKDKVESQELNRADATQQQPTQQPAKHSLSSSKAVKEDDVFAGLLDDEDDLFPMSFYAASQDTSDNNQILPTNNISIWPSFM